jgi:protein-tyrosine kinase
MSNIYEALERAQRDKAGAETVEMVQLPEDAPAKKTRLRSGRSVPAVRSEGEVGMSTLYRTIDMLLPEQMQKTIQFISTNKGEGVSTVVCEIAKTAANKLGRKVLVLDAAVHNPTQHFPYNAKRLPGLHDLLRNDKTFDLGCIQSGGDNLYVSSFPGSLANTLFFDGNCSLDFLDELKKRFDLILIDSSPVTEAPDSIMLARYVDGVILVLEAERTKWFAAENLKERIVKNGGNILGVVFNKRRYHIPKFIYDML